MPTTQLPEQVTILLQPKDRPSFDRELAEQLEIAHTLPPQITTEAEFTDVNAKHARLTATIKRFRPAFDKVCSDAHRAWESTTQLRALVFLKPERLAKRMDRLLSDYDRRREQERRAKEARLTEVAHQEELARREAEARILELQGEPDIAASVRATPVTTPTVTLPEPETPPDLSFQDRWAWRPAGSHPDTARDKTGLKAAAQVLPREFLTVDIGAVTAFVNRTRGTQRLPGIVIWDRRSTVRKEGVDG